MESQAQNPSFKSYSQASRNAVDAGRKELLNSFFNASDYKVPPSETKSKISRKSALGKSPPPSDFNLQALRSFEKTKGKFIKREMDLGNPRYA